MKKISCLFAFVFSMLLMLLYLTSCGTSSLAKIGMSKAECLALFEEKEEYPTYHSADEKRYYWYDDTFYDVFTKYNINLKEAEDQLALIQTSIAKNAELMDEVENLHFRFRFVTFDDEDKLSEFYYDFDHRFDLDDDYSCFELKEIEDLAFSKRKLEYYIEEAGQFKNNKNKICFNIKLVNFENINYTINFTDGTIYKGKLSDAITDDASVTVNVKSHNFKMYVETGDFSFINLKPAEFKNTEILKNINFEYYGPYTKAFMNLVDTASIVGYITRNKELQFWDTKVEYIPDYVDKDAYVGELTEKTVGGVKYKGYILNPYYEVVGVTNSDMKKIELKEGVQVIRNGALCGLNNIYELVIPEGVKTIEEGAINSCNNLLGVAIPASVEEIGHYNFTGCPKLIEIFNGSNVYTEEMAMSVIAGPAHYYDTYQKNSDKTLIEQFDETKHFRIYNKNNVNYVFAYLTNNDNDKFNTFESHWYFMGVIGGASKVNLPDAEIKIDKDTTISDYYVFWQAFKDDDKLTEVVLGDNVRVICSGAFYNCTNLKTVIAPGVKTICEDAFYNCESLESFTFDSVDMIKDNAFCNCNKLTEINLPVYTGIRNPDTYDQKDKYSGCFNYCTGITTVSMPEAIELEFSMFSGCKALTTFSAPKLTRICANAFFECENLVDFDTDYLEFIDGSAFFNCKKLTTIKLSDNAYNISSHAFDGCESLETYNEDNYKYLSTENNKYFYLFDLIDNTSEECTILDDVRFINTNLFDKFINLKHLTVQSNIEFYNLSEMLYRLTSLEYYEEDGIYYIGSVTNPYLAIVNVNKNEPNLVIKEDTKYIMSSAFEGSSITSLTIPENINHVGDRAFANTKITELDLNNIYFGLDFGVFSDNKELIRATVTNLSSGMFEGCTKLEEVTIYNSYLPGEIFKDCSNLKTLIMPNNMTLMNVDFSAFENCTSLESINLKNVTEIMPRAFYNCTSLSNVTSLKAVTEIGDQAFYNTKLTNVDLANIETISYGAFTNCTELTNVKLGVNLTNIGAFAFSGCTKLKDLNLPDALETLGEELFSKCSTLSAVMIPDSVFKYIMNVFRNCPMNTNIYYKGTYDDLKRLGFRKGMLELNQKLYIYSEEEPIDTDFEYWHYVNDEIVLWN